MSGRPRCPHVAFLTPNDATKSMIDAHEVMAQLRDQIAAASARLKAAIAAADHEQEAKLRTEISGLLDELDKISGLKAQTGAV
jgi:hypothetical protein